MHGFGGRFNRQSPCLPGAFPHEQSGGYPGSNMPTNRTGNQPGNARYLTGLQTRWRTGLERLNRPAWNDSEALDEAGKRQSDRRIIPTLICHGFRGGLTWRSRCNACSFQPRKVDVIPTRIHPLIPPAIRGESLVLCPPIVRIISRALRGTFRPRKRTFHVIPSSVPSATTIFSIH